MQPTMVMVSPDRISQYFGIEMRPNPVSVGNYVELLRKRGGVVPITVTESFELIHGADALCAYREIGASEVPAMVVETGGPRDVLLFILEYHAAQQGADSLTVSSVICKLIDEYKMDRSELAAILDWTPSWLSLNERLERHLCFEMKEMVFDGKISPRAAMEIARLPEEIQHEFVDCVEHRSMAQIRSMVDQRLLPRPVEPPPREDPCHPPETKGFFRILLAAIQACIELEREICFAEDEVICIARDRIEAFLALISVLREHVQYVFDLSQNPACESPG